MPIDSPGSRTLTGTIAFSSSAPRRGASDIAQATGDRRQHHVVERRAVRALDREQVVERRASIQTMLRIGESGPLITLSGAPVTSGPAHERPAACPRRSRGRRAGSSGRAQRPAEQADCSASEVTERRAATRRSTPPRLRGPPAIRLGERCRAVGGAGIGRGVEQQRAQLDRGDPVDHAVMQLADDRETPSARLRRRSTAPTGAGRGATAPTSPRRRARAATRRPVDVALDRERRIVDPLGRAQAERHRGELLAISRRARESAADVISQLGEARHRPRRRERRTWPPSPRACARSALSISRNDASRAERRPPRARSAPTPGRIVRRSYRGRQARRGGLRDARTRGTPSAARARVI